jgi:hypothetical protein
MRERERERERDETLLMDFAIFTKVVNFVPFRPEWPKHSILIQKIEQNGTNFI